MAAISVRKTTFLLFVMRVAKLLISIVSLTIIASYFGVSMERDMWVLSSAVIATITSSFWGPLNEIFRTKFVFTKEQEGEEPARKKTASLVGFIIWFSVLLGMAVFLLAKPIATLLAGSVSTEALDLLYQLSILLIPTILITELSNIITSILNAYNVFYIPEVVGWISGIINIIIIIFFAPLIGIYALMVSTYLSGLLLLVVLIIYLNRNNVNIWGRVFSFKLNEVWQFVTFALPFFFPYFVGQMNVVSEKVLAGMLGEGSIATIDYSRQFVITIQTVLSSVLTTVMVPLMAKAFINKNNSEFNSILHDNLQTCFIILGLCLVLLIGAADPICMFFFGRGDIGNEALSNIIALTRMYGIALVAVLLYMTFSLVLLSSNQRKIYAIVGVAVQVLVFILYIIFFKLTENLYVFPISFGLGHLAAAIVMFFAAKEINRKEILGFLLKSLFSIGLMVACVYAVLQVVNCSNIYMLLLVTILVMISTIPILLWGNEVSIKIIFQRVKSRLYGKQEFK